MRWILLGLALLSIKSFAIPNEILSGYLERHEMCIKDAQIRAQDSETFKKLKEQCRREYIKNVDGGDYSYSDFKNDNSPPVRDWNKFVSDARRLPSFEIESRRNYVFSIKRAKLGNLYITRDKHFSDRLVLWDKGVRVNNFYAIPYSNALYNARYIDGRIAVNGLDFKTCYYAVSVGSAYRMETEYGHVLKIGAALYLADKAIIVYNDVPVGIISRNMIEEID